MGMIWLIAIPRLVSRARMLEPYETNSKTGFFKRVRKKIARRKGKYRI
jgi:hypothetical protein